MKKNKIAVVIPTIRNLDFLESWGDWRNIDDDLGKNSWIIPRKNAGIRSYGFIKACQLNSDVIITLVPMCSMNLAFKTKIAAIMYFPLMGYDEKGNHWCYDRFDDIWAGIFAKKIIDHLNLAAVNGSSFIEHRQASNVFANLKKEAKGIETNEYL